MVSKEHESNRKQGTKFNLIKTIAGLEQAQKPGSSIHYESMLKKRKTGKFFVRNRDSDSDTPFDDEGESYRDGIGPTDIDAMTLDTFNARYLSQTSPEFRKFSANDA